MDNYKSHSQYHSITKKNISEHEIIFNIAVRKWWRFGDRILQWERLENIKNKLN